MKKIIKYILLFLLFLLWFFKFILYDIYKRKVGIFHFLSSCHVWYIKNKIKISPISL